MKLPLRIAAAAIAAGLLLTVGLFVLAQRVLSESFRDQLAADVSTRARIIREQLDVAVLIAKATASFAETTAAPDRNAFLSFAGHFIEQDAGLRALSFVAVVPGAGREQFEARARALSGKTDYQIYEGTPGVQRQSLRARSVYYPVLITNTRDASALVILGFDMGSSPVRLAALERACDTGEGTVTERITLAGATQRPGFIIFFPVYAAGAPTSTPEQRRAAISGFVQAIFSLDELVAVALQATSPVGLPFDLLDLSSSAGNRVAYHWSARLKPTAPWKAHLLPTGIQLTQEFPFAGRSWGIHATPGTAYLERHYPVAHLLILPVGLLLTCSLAAYLHAVLSRREELAAHNRALQTEMIKRVRVEDELRISERRHRIVADNTVDWEFWLDPAGHFIYCSPSSVRVTGFSHTQFLADPALLEKIILAEDLPSFAFHRDEVTTTPALATLTFRIRHRDGSTRWIDHTCQPVFDEDGRFAGTRGSNRDITDKKRIEEERERLITELQAARNDIRKLEGILPICASCKKIRDAGGAWLQIESYVSQHSGAEFTHGICPDCARQLYPEIYPAKSPPSG